MLDRLSRWASTRSGAMLGVVGSLGVGALVLAPGWAATPDAGYLAPLMAASAEDSRVEIISTGTTFGEILHSTTLDGNDQQALLTAFREHADPRRLRSGAEVTLRFVRGNDEIRGVDVAVSRDEIVRMSRGALGWASEIVATPVTVDTLVAQGTITSSLWVAMDRSEGLAGMVASDRAGVLDAMTKVFQWQIDFYRQIQRGDSFRLVFEREVRPDGTMRSTRILAAEVENSGKAFHAIWFDLHGDGVGGYYDRSGESLMRAFLKAPLEFRRISSGFSNGRLHPILNTIRAHRGVDYAAPTGTPVQATGEGKVTRRGVEGGYGNLVEIQHANGFVTRYGHLSRFATGLPVGTHVTQGQVIGFVGMTGLATGPHLHYEMHRSGTAIDPLTLDVPSGDPIPPAAFDRWTAELGVRYAMLVNLSTNPARYLADTGADPAADVAARNE